MDGLIGALAGLVNAIAQSKNVPEPAPVRPAPKKKVFASMPFAPQYDDTFLVAIEPASLTNAAIAERVDHDSTAGPVVPQIKAMIRAAKVVVADLSDSRPNVLYEVGYAEALRKPVIQICSTPTAALPFNVRNNQTISYAIGQTAKLKKRIEIEIAKYV
jgi:nucleoside 2-deoxyribosyltransferase